MRCQARTTSRIKIDIAVDDQQAKPGHAGKQGQQQQLPQVELAGLVRQHLANQYRPLRPAENAPSAAITAAARAPAEADSAHLPPRTLPGRHRPSPPWQG